MKFAKQKNGYDISEVDNYIEKLESEKQALLEKKDKEITDLKVQISKIQSSSNSIALALTAAVDKAKEIEESSKNIYKLKIEQMNILYTKWDMLLNEMLHKYPEIKNVSNVRQEVEALKNSIQNALKDDFNIEIMNTNDATDPIRNLLNKLTGRKNEMKKQKEMNEIKFVPLEKEDKKIVFERKTKVSSKDKTELSRLEEKNANIKPIVNMNLDKDDKYENLVDKFLNSDEETPENAMIANSKVAKSDNGFDLNDCINPKEDLQKIMESFDFFNNN